jgi:hypothetical protein
MPLRRSCAAVQLLRHEGRSQREPFLLAPQLDESHGFRERRVAPVGGVSACAGSPKSKKVCETLVITPGSRRRARS